ncbi:MAG: D-alanyl-D-alanine carboxypeptidase DacB [Candidatus Omnitrophica bacterium]|nr:D-alanyl-D-alanine carboxypeptidase DacB [Candidatus Omnitrophota bacterium]
MLVLATASYGQAASPPKLNARSAVILDVKTGKPLYAKNAHLKLPPASTTKIMTALLALETLGWEQEVTISRRAAAAPSSKADLRAGERYQAKYLILASLVSSSNDAAIALAEACSGTEEAFAERMNARALELGMKNTRFINATGLPDKRRKQYSTAYDLALLVRHASRDGRVDHMMAVTSAYIFSVEGRATLIRAHNKMLWRMPKFVKGKTGWTFASRHTFAGTNYESAKKFTFALLSSKEPWMDIERLANFGTVLASSRR